MRDGVLKKSVVLVGVMGAGKSTVGRLLAAKLACAFSDTDREMERLEHSPVRELWEDKGEQYFADLERSILINLLREPAHVIAAGGGAFVRDPTRALIKAQAISIWLQASSETIIRRVANGPDRPVGTRENAATDLLGLAERRAPIYSQADLMIPNDQLTPEEAAMSILAYLQARPMPHPGTEG